MDLRRVLLCIALLILGGYAAWVATLGLLMPAQAVVLAIVATSLIAVGLLFIGRRVGSLLALLAGAGGLLIGLGFWALLGFAGHDPTNERIAALAPGAATVMLAVIDLFTDRRGRARR